MIVRSRVAHYSDTTMAKSPKRTPLGVIAVALFYLIGAVAFIVLAVRRPEAIAAVATQKQVTVFALMVSTSLVIAIGLVSLKNWARYLMIVHLFLNGVSFVIAGYSPLNASVLLEAVLVAYVFLSPGPRKAFSE